MGSEQMGCCSPDLESQDFPKCCEPAERFTTTREGPAPLLLDNSVEASPLQNKTHPFQKLLPGYQQVGQGCNIAQLRALWA